MVSHARQPAAFPGRSSAVATSATPALTVARSSATGRSSSSRGEMSPRSIAAVWGSERAAVEAEEPRFRVARDEEYECISRRRYATSFHSRAPPGACERRCWLCAERSADARYLWVSWDLVDCRRYRSAPPFMSEAQTVGPHSRRSRRTPEGSRSGRSSRSASRPLCVRPHTPARDAAGR